VFFLLKLVVVVMGRCPMDVVELLHVMIAIY